MKKPSSLTGSRRNIAIAGVAVIVAIVLGYFFIWSLAAGPFLSIDPSASQLAGNAKVVTDDGVRAIQFTAPVPTTPPPTTPPPTTPPPSSGGKPTPETTGVIPGVALQQHNGNYTISADGTTISNLNITGNLYVVANNVTVKNVKVNGFLRINMDSGGFYPHPVKKNMSFTNIDVQTIDNLGLEGVTIDKARVRGQGDGTHFQATNYKESGKFWQCNGLTLTNSLFDAPPAATDPSTHREDFHPMGCTNMVIRNNVFDMTPVNAASKAVTTAAVFFQTWNDITNENVTYDGNYHYGGGYFQIYFNAKNMSVTNNKFYTYAGGDIVYPPRSYSETYYPFTQSGNTIDDKPATLLNSK
jgi:hypothetical protein